MLTTSVIKTNDQLLTAADLRRIGVHASNTTLIRWEAGNRFPRRIYVGVRRAWIRSEIEAWITARAAERAHRVYSNY